MANSSIPGPLGLDAESADTDVKLSVRHRVSPGPIRVAEGPTNKSKKTAKAAPAATNKTIIFHIYAPIIPVGDTPGNKGYSVQEFIDWFKAPDASDIRH
jgi:hypothetical protein